MSSFRDFIQKLADAGHVKLKQVDRSLLVELRETKEDSGQEFMEPQAAIAPEAPPFETAAPAEPPVNAVPSVEALRILEELLRESKSRPHWPMYLRSFKQFIRSLHPPFDERQYGFSSTYELVRLAQKEGLLRVERNRQGVLRIFPAERFPQAAQPQSAQEAAVIEPSEPETEIVPVEPETLSQETYLQQELPVPEPIVEVLPAQHAAGSELQLALPIPEAPAPQRAKRKRKTTPTPAAKTGKSEKRKAKSTRESQRN